MKNDVKSISKRFIKNIGYCDLISTIVYTMRGKTIDYKNIEECLNVMRRKFTFDKIDKSLVAARMSLVDEKDMYLADIVDVYRKVEKGSFPNRQDLETCTWALRQEALSHL